MKRAVQTRPSPTSSRNSSLLLVARRELRRVADSRKAPFMQAYMKSEMLYHGVSAPLLRQSCRTIFAGLEFRSRAAWRAQVLALWRGATHREERYVAIALTGHKCASEYQTPAAMPLYEEIIVTGAWWDYVDELAHRVGELLLRWPAEVRPAVVTWTRSDDRWLRRASIICQLGTRDQTDVGLLTTAIEAATGDSDFFLRKAIGWALRDYARTNPAWVRSFAETHELSPLSRREALKHLS